MSWHACTICESSKTTSKSKESSAQKIVNYHEQSPTRTFRITINPVCQEKQENEENDEMLENVEPSGSPMKPVNFFVDLAELIIVCPFFSKFEGVDYVELSTNCTDTWVSAPETVSSLNEACRHKYAPPIKAKNFHAFLESACPSLYGIRPAPLTMESIIPVLDILSHFHSEPLLTNCERFLMSTNINQLEGSQLIRLIDKGLCVSLDHRILGRIVCVCLMNVTTKLSDVSQELVGTVGSVFAQAFIANNTKSFRHIKPLEQDSILWPVAIRNLMNPSSSPSTATSSEEARNTEEKKKSKKRSGNRKKSECDHTEDSFECILCFDQRCGKCKGEAAFCYKAMDNFLYEVRLQLYPHTYRPHLDRDLLREDRLSDYILRHQLQPLPEN